MRCCIPAREPPACKLCPNLPVQAAAALPFPCLPFRARVPVILRIPTTCRDQLVDAVCRPPRDDAYTDADLVGGRRASFRLYK